MKLHKSLIIITLTVILVLSSCQSNVPEDVVKSNDGEMISVSYNGVEYIESEYDSSDNFRPFLCHYSLTECEYNIFRKDVYSIDESFVADKRDENVNFIYIPLLLWETSIYQRKDFVVPELKDIHDKIDNILIVYPDINDDDVSEKQVIDDAEQVSLILEFFESFNNAEIIEEKGLPSDNKKIDICAVSGYYGGEFDVGQGTVYYSNDELIVFFDGKQYKAPEEVNEIFRNAKRTKYNWEEKVVYLG